MQSDRRLIQHIQRTHKMRAERRGQLNPLRFAAGQASTSAGRASNNPGPLHPEIAAAFEFPPGFYPQSWLALSVSCSSAKNRRASFTVSLHKSVIVLPLIFTARASARSRVPPHSGQVAYPRYRLRNTRTCSLYFLRSSQLKNPFTPVDICFPDRLRESAAAAPRSSCRHGTFVGIPCARAHFRASCMSNLIARLGPRLNRAVIQRFAGVRHHQVQIEINRVSESLAARARSIRIVERKQPRLRLLIQRAVVLAFESLVERQALRRISGRIRNKFQNRFPPPSR